MYMAAWEQGERFTSDIHDFSNGEDRIRIVDRPSQPPFCSQLRMHRIHSSTPSVITRLTERTETRRSAPASHCALLTMS